MVPACMPAAEKSARNPCEAEGRQREHARVLLGGLPALRKGLPGGRAARGCALRLPAALAEGLDRTGGERRRRSRGAVKATRERRGY